MLLISNGRVMDPASGTDSPRDILLDGDRIAAVAPQAATVGLMYGMGKGAYSPVAAFPVAKGETRRYATSKGAAAGRVMQQLEAFRRDDYDTAYTFASAKVRQIFDRRAFEQMVKRGYPEIARSTLAVAAESQVTRDGHVFLRVKVRGANGNSVEAVYDMIREGGSWKINGVVARPDPGFV